MFSPMIRICSEVFLEFSACSAELSTTWFTAVLTFSIVPLVLSAAVCSNRDASRSVRAFLSISLIVSCIASRRVIVTLDRSPVSSFCLSMRSSTHTVRSPAAIFPTALILVRMFLLMEDANFIPTIMQTIITANTAALNDQMIWFITISFSCLSVPTKTMPIISSVEPFW